MPDLSVSKAICFWLPHYIWPSIVEACARSGTNFQMGFRVGILHLFCPKNFSFYLQYFVGSMKFLSIFVTSMGCFGPCMSPSQRCFWDYHNLLIWNIFGENCCLLGFMKGLSSWVLNLAVNQTHGISSMITLHIVFYWCLVNRSNMNMR